MRSVFEEMEYCFVCDPDELIALSTDPEWRIRYAAAVAIGLRKDVKFLPYLERMLEIEEERPLFSQPASQYTYGDDDVTLAGDTTMAEQVRPFRVIFPEPVDADTQEAWKTRGRIIQAILFSIYEIGSANVALIDKMHHYLEDPQQDAVVKAAAARALGKVGNKCSLPYCEMASAFDEWCTRVEAQKAIEVLKSV